VNRASRNAAGARSAKVARIRKPAKKTKRGEAPAEGPPSRATALKARAIGR
jgi:hypothetical protein